MIWMDINVLLSLIVSYSIRFASCNVCTYANCEPVDQFLAAPSPQVIGPQCATCSECAALNFSTCTLVHTNDGQNGAHCVCGNTLPSSCEHDHIRLTDILEKDANSFDHDYTCTFSNPDAFQVLPKLGIVANETGVFKAVEIPLQSLSTNRRFTDLNVRTISLYVFNESKSELEQAPLQDFSSSQPYARIYLGSDGSPVLVEPEGDRINHTRWPKVEFPQLDYIPSTVAYSLDTPGRRLIVDPEDNTVAKSVPFWYSRFVDTADVDTTDVNGVPVGPRHTPNYTLVVLIVVGVVLLLLLCCAFISCKDKLRHGKYLKTIQNEVATPGNVESGKSAAVATHPQTYTPVKNGMRETLPADRESTRLLASSETRDGDASTLPLSSKTPGKSALVDSTFRPQQSKDRTPSFPGTVPSLDRHRDSSLGRPTREADSNQRDPANVEADRKQFLRLAKDATIIKAVDLDLLESIGNGEFGIIRRGYVFDRTEAMIHCLRPPHRQSTDSMAESLVERLDASGKAGFHPHIVSLLGLCQEGDILYVCMQLETGPNLRNMLRESRSLDQFLQYTNARGRLSLMSPQRLLNIILGIARGMGHLEECQVLHDSLAAVNIVICDNGTPKIAGFGMATLSDLYMRQLEKNHDQLRWLPPETHDTGLFTMKSQTWSFGVVLWEIVTFGATPYYNMSDEQVIRRVAEGHRLHRPSNCSRQVYDLMDQCWRRNGDDRPDFSYVQQHVHELNLDPELHVSVIYHEGFNYEPIRETWNT